MSPFHIFETENIILRNEICKFVIIVKNMYVLSLLNERFTCI